MEFHSKPSVKRSSDSTESPANKANKTEKTSRQSSNAQGKKFKHHAKARKSQPPPPSLTLQNRLHENLWFNEPGKAVEGPVCRCSHGLRSHGPQHGRFALETEETVWPSCTITIQKNQPSPVVVAPAAAIENQQLKPNPIGLPMFSQLDERVHDNQKQNDAACHLFHYFMKIVPSTNYVSDCARRTYITNPGDGQKYFFEGFYILSHEDMAAFPHPDVILFGYQYSLTLQPVNFSKSSDKIQFAGSDPDASCAAVHDIQKADMLTKYLTVGLLQLLDWNLQPSSINLSPHHFPESSTSLPNHQQQHHHCDFMHFMPCFRHASSGRVLQVRQILEYCTQNYWPLLTCDDTAADGSTNADGPRIKFYKSTSLSLSHVQHSRVMQTELEQVLRGAIVHNPNARPSAVRVDQVDMVLTADEQQELHARDKASAAVSTTDANNDGDDKKAEKKPVNYPVLFHFGHKPAHLACCGNPEYLAVLRRHQRLTHLMQNKPKAPTDDDRTRLAILEEKLLEMRKNGNLKREVRCMLDIRGFHHTGLSSDIMQQALLLPVLTFHYRYHRSLRAVEQLLGHKFRNRRLLQLAFTHPSFRMTYGTNADHVRNSLTNCGARHMVYGPMHVQYQQAARKSGIKTQTEIMSRLGSEREQQSRVLNYERLEFLGDAVLEFVVRRRLYMLFPEFQEGVLATYRSAMVDNAHLGYVAEQLKFRDFLLISHSNELGNEMDVRHTLANCYEACIGALYLDTRSVEGENLLDKVDIFIGKSMFCYAVPPPDEATVAGDEKSTTSNSSSLEVLQRTWLRAPRQQDFCAYDVYGDRQAWFQKVPTLKHLVEFEKLVGVQFKRIALLAQAFVSKSFMPGGGGGGNTVVGTSVVVSNGPTTANTTAKKAALPPPPMPMLLVPQIVNGNNERLEFLGDAVLQMVVSEHLYKHYATHHEGHLSLLRSCLVNNHTLAFVCDELNMDKFQHSLFYGATEASAVDSSKSSKSRRSKSLEPGELDESDSEDERPETKAKTTIPKANAATVIVDNNADDADRPQQQNGQQTEQQQRRAKHKADLVEAFIGALYLDQGLGECCRFIHTYIIVKAQTYIQEQRWTDPKSLLQQCCLTLRSVTDGRRKPDIPRYQGIEESGPANQRTFRVAVYFRKEKLAEGVGRSVTEAQAKAAANALHISPDLSSQVRRMKQRNEQLIEQQLRQRKQQQQQKQQSVGENSKNKRESSSLVARDRHGNAIRSPSTRNSSSRATSPAYVSSTSRSRDDRSSSRKNNSQVRRRERSRDSRDRDRDRDSVPSRQTPTLRTNNRHDEHTKNADERRTERQQQQSSRRSRSPRDSPHRNHLHRSSRSSKRSKSRSRSRDKGISTRRSNKRVCVR